MIPERVERRARWVLDSIGARDLGVGDDMAYDAGAWEQVDRGELPSDVLAAAFFHLARVEERNGARDEHDRFRAAASCLDPLDPPLERLRRELGVEAPRWGGGRFAVALTHDVDTPWKWTRLGLKGAAARSKSDLAHGRVRSGLRELRGLAGAPLHKASGTDPFWSFDRILADERRFGSSSTFFLMADHAHELDGPAGERYEELRPRLVETLLEGGAEVGLHGSYSAADDPARIASEKETLEQLAGSVHGQRYHFLRLDPHRNLGQLEAADAATAVVLAALANIGFKLGMVLVAGGVALFRRCSAAMAAVAAGLLVALLLS